MTDSAPTDCGGLAWRRCTDVNELRELLAIVEPNVWDAEGLTTRFPDRYRAYVACDARVGGPGGRVEAMGIAALLPTTKTLYIEDFALHPRVRERGLARPLYKAWRSFMLDDWPATRVCGDSTLIEVYLQNLDAWRAIMGVAEVRVDALPLLLAKRTPVRVMACRLTAPPADAYAEYQRLQREWIVAIAATAPRSSL